MIAPGLPSGSMAPWAVDLRGKVRAPKRKRDPGKIVRLVVHRVGGTDWPTNAELLAEALAPTWQQYLGDPACPYWALIEPTGRLVVMHDVTRRGSHAGKYDSRGRPAGSYNHESLPVGMIGDFRHAAPTAVARLALLHQCQWFLDETGFGVPSIGGHDELPGATPGKVCPGPLLSMDALREDLAAGHGLYTR